MKSVQAFIFLILIGIAFALNNRSYVATNPASNAYPNRAASLTSPSLSSPLYIISTAIASVGTFSDIDGYRYCIMEFRNEKIYEVTSGKKRVEEYQQENCSFNSGDNL